MWKERQITQKRVSAREQPSSSNRDSNHQVAIAIATKATIKTKSKKTIKISIKITTKIAVAIKIVNKTTTKNKDQDSNVYSSQHRATEIASNTGPKISGDIQHKNLGH